MNFVQAKLPDYYGPFDPARMSEDQMRLIIGDYLIEFATAANDFFYAHDVIFRWNMALGAMTVYYSGLSGRRVNFPNSLKDAIESVRWTKRSKGRRFDMRTRLGKALERYFENHSDEYVGCYRSGQMFNRFRMREFEL